MSDTTLLRVEGLRKEYGEDVVAVDDVSFGLGKGEALAVVGESGSGKTTLAKMVVGLIDATAGSIALDGEVRSAQRANRRERRARARQLQLVFQDPYSSLDPRQRTGDGLIEVLRLHHALDRRTGQARVDELLDQVGLDARVGRALPRDLSGGQRQRVAIARALAAEPQVLILDEAVAALDVSVQAQVLNLLKDIREQTDVAYLFISHDLAVVRQVTDRVLVMHHGRVVERGRTAAVLDHPQHPYTQSLRASVPGPGWVPRRRSPTASEATA